MTWKDYFTLINVQPGLIVTPRFGTLDFSDPNLPVEKLQALFEDDFPYLRITPLGMEAPDAKGAFVFVKNILLPHV